MIVYLYSWFKKDLNPHSTMSSNSQHRMTAIDISISTLYFSRNSVDNIITVLPSQRGGKLDLVRYFLTSRQQSCEGI